jgi:SAM-dependent methyltransferase
MNSRSERQIARNIEIHDRLSRKYEARHGEIFNDLEQSRLAETLAQAREAVRTGDSVLRALDFGCGSGNLTRHLLELGFEVTAADVSQGFLDLVRDRYPTVKTFLMNGRDLSGLVSGGFDLVATYSVLHHVPDYLAAVREMGRVAKAGGVLVIDHEPTEEFWKGDAIYREFRKKALRVDWRKYLAPINYLHRIRRLFQPRHAVEGDIHVWHDDHVEWDRVKEVLADFDFEVVAERDYLLYRTLYRRAVYEEYRGRCTDTKSMIFRKRSVPEID